jgi:hypothetical protein
VRWELSLADWLDSRWQSRRGLAAGTRLQSTATGAALSKPACVCAVSSKSWPCPTGWAWCPTPERPDDLVSAEVDIALSLGDSTCSVWICSIWTWRWRGPAQSWELDLSGDSIEGRDHVPVPLDSGRVLVADLRHLYLEPIKADEAALDLAIIHSARRPRPRARAGCRRCTC